MSITKKILMCSGQASSDSWYLEYGGFASGYDNKKGKVAFDSSNNVYLLNEDVSPGNTSRFSLVKFNSDGNLIWQKVTQTGAATLYPHGVAVDPSDNVYMCGFRNGFNAGGGQYVVKLNSSGVKQWEAFFGGTTGSADVALSIDLDSSGNVYVSGTIDGQSSNTSGPASIVKINSSGVIQWERCSFERFGLAEFRGIVTKSSASYVCGSQYSNGQATFGLAASYSNAGTVQWQYILNGNHPLDVAHGIDVDSSGNSYIAMTTVDQANTSSTGMSLIKLNSSGALQWQRIIVTSSGDLEARDVALDSSGNAYICGFQTGVSGQNDIMIIAKYNSSGTLQWQKVLQSNYDVGGGSGDARGEGVAVDSNDNVYFSGSIISGSNDRSALLFKPPTNGSATGIYSRFTYYTSTFTEKAGGITVGSASFTNFTPTTGTSSSTLSVGNNTLSTAIVQM